MGADSGLHIELPDSAPAPEPLGIARTLKAVLDREKEQGRAVDMVIMGKQAIDDDLGQTGQMLAALWGDGDGVAQATYASKVEVDVEEGVARVTTEIDGGGRRS